MLQAAQLIDMIYFCDKMIGKCQWKARLIVNLWIHYLDVSSYSLGNHYKFLLENKLETYVSIFMTNNDKCLYLISSCHQSVDWNAFKFQEL